MLSHLEGFAIDHSSATSTQDDRYRYPNINSNTNPLAGKRVLVAIVSFDFSQVPHLEEVLDSYHDLCFTGVSKIDIVVHTTIAYPVTLIDLWNTRINRFCKRRGRNNQGNENGQESDGPILDMTIVVKPYSLRLFLVDCHRYLFYEKIDDYDLFIYTEDDMIIHPKLVASYLEETERVIDLVGLNKSQDYNVGIVRYEYNFPSNIIIDDK